MKFAFQLLAAFIVGLAVLALLVPAAHADSCAAVVHRRVVVEAATYAPSYNAVATVAVPVYAVQVPAYSASYQPTTTLSPEATLLLQQMTALLQSHETRLSQVEHGQQPPALPVQPSAAPRRPDVPPPVPPMPSASPEAAGQGTPKIFAVSCVKCHDGNAAKAEGHVLFANGQPTFMNDPGELGEIIDRVTRSPGTKGAMSPDGTATDDDVNGAVAFCKTALRQQAQARK